MSAKIILASSSPYRKQQLAQLGLKVDSASPDIDESPHSAEAPQQLAERLALAKARKIAEQFPDAIVIGSDQTASVDINGEALLLGKAGNFTKAKQQLTQCQGKTVIFYSVVCLHCASSNKQLVRTEITKVNFRQLSDADIDAYLHCEQPYDCAGSFKAEGKGILLLDELSSRDPNALIGMPVILLREMLAEFDIDLLRLATQPVA
ncbi:Maf family protein [Alteromonas ponticola]|uniref:7-methyl-GTP pyrophosphatase n=1 Tax=Alteromonas ponticola TaxID=2720613 RepID=A0ABX1QWR0_9ALTE|nr:Maf family nucleotide pyrophosphatase [Alteromonas ponticola]NMH58682.1 septum formation protein Maf [Alteromonas ponticola]